MTNKKRVYLSNKDLLQEVLVSKQQNKMTDKLAEQLVLLTNRYARKGNFSGYTFNEDMRAYALLMLVKTWHKFNPEQSVNPFAFYTQCIKNSFVQFLNQEKKQRNIRDQLLVNQGMNPSFSFADGYTFDGDGSTDGDGTQNRNFAEDEQDFETYKQDTVHQDTPEITVDEPHD